MEFKLFEEFSKLDVKELVLLVLGALAAAALLFLLAAMRKKRGAGEPATPKAANTRALVYGALSLSLSFVLSYFKLFELPMGGSVTLLSMLPLVMYAAAFGPARGFTAAFAYSLLQVVQGAYVVHWAQFMLDYILAFTCFGLAAFFPKRLWLGLAVSGFGRFICSVLSGVIFFSAYAAEAGYQSAWLYSIAYNGSTLGVDTLLCIAASFVPAIKTVIGRMKAAA